VTVLHGYPASAGAGLLAVAGVVAATAVSWRVLGPRPPRTVSRAALVVAVAALVAGTGLAAAAGAAPGVPHHHEYRDARTVGEPSGPLSSHDGEVRSLRWGGGGGAVDGGGDESEDVVVEFGGGDV
jgi:hypothetical protein